MTNTKPERRWQSFVLEPVRVILLVHTDDNCFENLLVVAQLP